MPDLWPICRRVAQPARMVAEDCSGRRFYENCEKLIWSTHLFVVIDWIFDGNAEFVRDGLDLLFDYCLFNIQYSVSSIELKFEFIIDNDNL